MICVDSLLRQYLPAQSHWQWLRALLRRLLYENDFQQFGRDYPHLKGLDFIEQVLTYFDFGCDVSESELEHIPSQGALVLAANHPIGTLDGMALLKVVARVRPDVKIMANQMLSHVEPMTSLLFPVDVLGSGSNRQQILAMQAHLAAGKALIVFPAGEVSRLRPHGVRDGRWHTGFLRLAAKAQAPIVPLFIRGRNSPLFYLSSMVFKPLSTLLLIREMFAHRCGRIRLRIGPCIPYSAWQHSLLSLPKLAGRFRQHLYRLGKGKPGLFHTEAPIALAEDRQRLKQALARCERLGQTHDGKQILLYRRQGEAHAPILRELGRLREIAFRAVGEGSGRRRDLDQYDDDYFHLVLWDPEALEIVGAYRFIPTAGQLADKGVGGLYSHSLFDFTPAMTQVLAQGIELGRSFIQPAYWGRRSLDYLWQGIGAFLARHPEYRYLFGPVSLSASLPEPARQLLLAFYRRHFPAHRPMAYSHRPCPPCPAALMALFSGDYQADLILLKARLEEMDCTIPTLYKQYSELCHPGGVQFLDFGEDPAFGHCIDGLVLVDLDALKPNKQQRYIGMHLSKPAAA